ncbi:GxxExxY protein, partial [Candidatus Uhrbacteria bacterium]|nr:GxxExxY protein [Candidatus Uhrbacteria bacterium]
SLELSSAGIKYIKEMPTSIYYKNQQIGIRRVDFFIENRIMLEIKAVSELDNTHLAQAKNYLEAYRIKNGLLINFGANDLQFKRLFNNR